MDVGAQPPRRVAVIGIHGVGEHASGDTARAIVRQLQHTYPGIYGAFEEASLKVAVDARELGLTEQDRRQGRRGLARLWAGMQSSFRVRGEPPRDVEVDIAFSKSLLKGGENYASEYSTVRLGAGHLKGALELPAGADTQITIQGDMDVYELFWSDLSHFFGSGALAIFDQVLQLLVHLASLGRTAVAATLSGPPLNPRKLPWWKLFYGLTAFSYWLLSTPILLGNLLFVFLAGLLVPALLPLNVIKPATAALAGLTAAGFVGWIVYGWLGRANVGRVSIAVAASASLLMGLAAGGVWFWMHDAITAKIDPLLVMAWLEILPLWLVGDSLARRYDALRPGAYIVWYVLVGVLALWMAEVLVLVWNRDGAVDLGSLYSPLIPWLGHSAEGLFSLLLVAWLLMYASSLALCLVGLGLKYIGVSTRELRSTVNTALLTACLPAPLFLTMVLCLWALFANSFADSLDSVSFEPWCKFLFSDGANGAGSAASFVSALINESVPGFALYVAVMVLAAALVVWGTLPSAFAEVFPPDRAKARQLTPSQSLGIWLNSGFRAIDLAGFLAGVGFFIVLPLGVAANFRPGLHDALLRIVGNGAGMSFMDIAGLAIGGSTVGFLAATKLFASSFSGFFQRLRVVVDTVLDVDNWLRERPIGSTVRLKIFARYASLLRHIAAQGYDRILIVSHSQGTVVTTDAFRYLQTLPGGLLSRLPPCRLLTMGSPLRQLYAWRLPSLYGWAIGAPPGTGPMPGDCGFAKWNNAYGSGDYVGRNLWPTAFPFVPGSFKAPILPYNYSEFCIGAAAHTHYFDEGNEEVGECIHALTFLP
jgi:hypothetical protein